MSEQITITKEAWEDMLKDLNQRFVSQARPVINDEPLPHHHIEDGLPPIGPQVIGRMRACNIIYQGNSVAYLYDKMKNNEKALDNHKLQITEQQTKIDILENECKTWARKFRADDEEIARLNGLLTAEEDSVRGLMKHITSVEKERDAAMERHSAAARRWREQTKIIDQLKSRSSEDAVKIGDLEATIYAGEKHYRRLQDKWAGLPSPMEVAEHEATIAAHVKTIKEQQDRINSLVKENKKLRKEDAALIDKIQNLRFAAKDVLEVAE